ncbi:MULTISPECIES: hypothetical protein [Stutzerimonas]|uniref:Uncharacterized protein n=1 Tax=Stutzerimonas xanthomarina TaxID=271420 RepID=A0A427DLZ6_9GAMM|nr:MULTISPECIES: hypothetical protein [Stutzerimonas]MBT1119296.1 hypothetical protein [Stutzerimonas nitrititolerans]MDH0084687.1 hypothetical protein [Stutzerimonas stutzeri]RRV04338.1 hypothetical protein EGJ28_22455 [Stutzerimonas xanthomarina]RRV44727.1 hypothetical protein EGJ26_20120 [Stutzerimonas stutzeri]RRV52113.1 hypothetical protein EGJ19_14925 [Stutzerimonas stutzeri]
MNSAVSDAFARMQIKIAGVARLKKGVAAARFQQLSDEIAGLRDSGEINDQQYQELLAELENAYQQVNAAPDVTEMRRQRKEPGSGFEP